MVMGIELTSYYFHRLLNLSLDDMIFLDEYDATGPGKKLGLICTKDLGSLRWPN